jgi:putative ABC transport system permease protein
MSTILAMAGRPAVREAGYDARRVPREQRTTSDAPIGEAARAALGELDPDQPIYDVSSMGARLSCSLKQRNFTLVVLEVFSALALLMAALGFYAVLTQSVAAWRGEIGIRVAVGARRIRVVGLIARESATLVLAGVPLGVLCSLLSRLVTACSTESSPAIRSRWG